MKYIEKLVYCAFFGYLLLSQTVFAKQAELAAEVKACSKISNNQARLTCFDQLTAIKSYQVQLSKTTGLKATGLKTELTVEQVDSFSKEQIEKTAEEKASEIKTILSTISKLEKTSRGKWKITFDSGQKWQQKDTSKLKLKQGDRVTLTKGALGSVFLQKENSNKRIKVKRLK